MLADDEFYDAVESGLDKMEEEQELRERLKSGQVVPVTPPPTSPAICHRLWPEVSSGLVFFMQINHRLIKCLDNNYVNIK